MKQGLCELFTEVVKQKGLTFSDTGKLSGMSKTQVNNIINHNGKEVSLEKIMNGLTLLGCEIEISIKGDK